MNLEEFEKRFNLIKRPFKTKDLSDFSKMLIKEKQDVSFLKDIILLKQEYHRIYFQVHIGLLSDIDEKLKFIEDNFDLLNDWWHVDQLEQFISKDLEFDYIYEKAKEYIKDGRTFVRRWGYVIFMPKLVKDKKAIKLFNLFKNNDEYYDVMAQAWLISYLAIYFPNETYEYIKSRKLNYNIIGKAIQKICDSFRINNDYKLKIKELRNLYK